MRATCRMAVLLVVLVSSTGTGAAEGNGRSAELIGAALVEGGAWKKLEWLCDRIGPRLPGSSNLERAVEWAVAELREDGLEKVWTEEVAVPHWVRGAETARVVAPVEQRLAISTLGGSIATPDGGVTAPVLEVRDFEDLEARAAEVPGKIVLYNKEILRNGGPNRDQGYGSAAGLRVRGAIEAARLGAVGTLVRSLGTADFRLPHTGMMRYDEEVPEIPSAAVSAEDAELLHRLLVSGDEVKVHLELGCEIRPDATSHNVIADLRGRERPEEIVLIGCHLDSWDVGTGAIDDGAGCAVVMETMRLLARLDRPPRRTVRAVLYTAEENGLWGGKAYAEAHAEELPRHVAALESDSGGSAPLGFGVSSGPGGVEIVRAIAAPLASIGAASVREGGGGPDISPTKEGLVPQMNLRHDTTHYFDYHHSEADTLDKVDPGDLARNAAAMAVMTWGLAEREATLPRLPPPEPEGIDQSRAARKGATTK